MTNMESDDILMTKVISLTDELKRCQEAELNLKTVNNLLTEEMVVLNTEISSLKKEVCDLKTEIEANRKVISSLADEKQQLEKELTENVEAQFNMRESNSKMNQKIRDLHTEIAQVKSMKLENIIDELEKKFDNFRDDVLNSVAIQQEDFFENLDSNQKRRGSSPDKTRCGNQFQEKENQAGLFGKIMNVIRHKPENVMQTRHNEDVYDQKEPPRLKNSGSNCYLNAAIQGVSSCDLFVKGINDLYNSINLEGDNDLKNLRCFRNFITYLNTWESNTAVNLRKEMIFQEWNKVGQQDSFEVLSYVINEVYKEIRRYKELKKEIQSPNDWINVLLPMRIRFVYQITCNDKHTIQTPVHAELAIHVSIPEEYANQTLDLKALLDKHFFLEDIENFSCSTCGTQHGTKLARLLKPLPSTLCIHVQRTRTIEMKTILMRNVVKFKTSLYIEKWYYSEENNDDKEHPDNESLYYLSSVVVHTGTAQSGHYFCYRLFKGHWFCISDTYCKKVPESEMLNCNPCLLFYETASSV